MSTTTPIRQAGTETSCPVVPLTLRERIVLNELTSEDTLSQIAARLFVSRNTVKSQVRAVYRKIGVSTREDAITWAREHRIRHPR